MTTLPCGCCEHSLRLLATFERIADRLDQLVDGPEASGQCPHPEAARDHSETTMGHPRWTCTACGYRFEATTSAAEG